MNMQECGLGHSLPLGPEETISYPSTNSDVHKGDSHETGGTGGQEEGLGVLWVRGSLPISPAAYSLQEPSLCSAGNQDVGSYD